MSKDGDIVKPWTSKPSALIPRVHSSFITVVSEHDAEADQEREFRRPTLR